MDIIAGINLCKACVHPRMPAVKQLKAILHSPSLCFIEYFWCSSNLFHGAGAVPAPLVAISRGSSRFPVIRGIMTKNGGKAFYLKRKTYVQ
jgi:hypothetical protein